MKSGFQKSQINGTLRITDHFQKVVDGGVARFQFHGKKDADVFLRLFSKHFLATGSVSLEPTSHLIMVARDKSQKRWIVNRSEVDEKDVVQIFPDEKLRDELWSPRMNIFIAEVKIYNPRQENVRRRHLPLATLRCHEARSPLLSALDATEAEIAGIIHVIVSSHILGFQPRSEVLSFISDYPRQRAATKAEATNRGKAKVAEQDAVESMDPMKRYLASKKQL